MLDLHTLFEICGTLGRVLAYNPRSGKGDGGAYGSGCFFGGRELDGRGSWGFGVATITEPVEEGGGLLEQV